MRKIGLIILVLGAVIYLTGCGRKEKPLAELQEPMSMEALSTLTNEAKVAPENQAQVTQALPLAPANLEPLPPAGPYQPTPQEIQAALKNAGYYAGAVDDKIGPQTKKAIEEFQKAKGLQVDGKVGPKTWAVLGYYLNPVQDTQPAPTRKKR